MVTNGNPTARLRTEEEVMEKALVDLEAARKRCRSQLLRSLHDAGRRNERAQILAATGGSPGKIQGDNAFN